MNTTSIAVDFRNNDLEDKLKMLLEKAPKELIRDIINTYYSYAAQQHVNDKNYMELTKLEGLIDLYNLLG